MPGVLEPLISAEQFEAVQVVLKNNTGLSSTLNRTTHRDHPPKGLIRCAHCGTNGWAKTYRNGHCYHRETHAADGAGECPARGGWISCDLPDEQIARIVQAIELLDDWKDRALILISEEDAVTRVQEECVSEAEWIDSGSFGAFAASGEISPLRLR